MDFNEQVEQLAQETSSLRNDISELNDLVTKLNNNVITLMRKQGAALQEHSKEIERRREGVINPYKSVIHMFPITSQEKLESLEADINFNNKREIVAYVRALLNPGGFKKNLTKLLSPSVIVEYNVDGVHNKRRIRDYPKFMDVLFRATYKEGWCHKYFLEDLRVGFKAAKNKYFKNNWCQRKKQELYFPQIKIEEVIIPADINE